VNLVTAVPLRYFATSHGQTGVLAYIIFASNLVAMTKTERYPFHHL
jgi:hypothetical protein